MTPRELLARALWEIANESSIARGDGPLAVDSTAFLADADKAIAASKQGSDL
jgi:hypothetical protein